MAFSFSFFFLRQQKERKGWKSSVIASLPVVALFLSVIVLVFVISHVNIKEFVCIYIFTLDSNYFMLKNQTSYDLYLLKKYQAVFFIFRYRKLENRVPALSLNSLKLV